MSKLSFKLIGQRFGRLLVIGRMENDHRGYTCWLAACSCGNFKIVKGSLLVNEITSSCGCLRRETCSVQGKSNRTHGDKGTRFYRIWAGMKARGNGFSDRNYSSKNIKVCVRWKRYENFKDDMYESYLSHCLRYSTKNTSIDRIDNDGDYTPRNCRWATREKQIFNSNGTKWFRAARISDGFKVRGKNLSRFCRKHKLDRRTVSRCLNAGSSRWSSHKGWTFNWI